MNLQERWKDIDTRDSDLSLLIKKDITSIASKDPLEKIKANLLRNAILGILISGVYIFLISRFPVWQVFVCIGIVLAFTIWAVVRALSLYAEMRKSVPNQSVLQEMERHYRGIKEWISIQQSVALLVYPVSAAGGFMIGGSLGAGKSIDDIMNKPVMIIALVITILILVPICFYFARWMCKKAFGNYAEQLRKNIEALKSSG